MWTYNAGAVATAEVPIAVGGSAGAVGAALVTAVAGTAGVTGLNGGSADGGSGHESSEDGDELHFGRVRWVLMDWKEESCCDWSCGLFEGLMLMKMEDGILEEILRRIYTFLVGQSCLIELAFSVLLDMKAKAGKLQCTKSIKIDQATTVLSNTLSPFLAGSTGRILPLPKGGINLETTCQVRLYV